MGLLKLGGMANSIQRKVSFAFVIIILIMSAVSFLSIRGIRRLSNVVESTEQVNQLQNSIFHLRLYEKRAFLSGNTALINKVDSLTFSISSRLQNISQSEANPQTKELLAPMHDLVTAFNKDFKLYASLHNYQNILSFKTDSIYDVIEKEELRHQELIEDWIAKKRTIQQTTLEYYNKAHALLIAIRSMQNRIEIDNLGQARRDSLETWFDNTINLTFTIENQVNNIEARSHMKQFRADLRHYEQTIFRTLDLINNLNAVQTSLKSNASTLQRTAEQAATIQSQMLSKWGVLSLRFLVILVAVAIIAGILVLRFFVFTITSDERKRRHAENAIEDNRRLLDDIINNSKALIYVKDLEGRYSLVNQNWCDEVGLKEEDVIGKKAEILFAKEPVEQWREVDLQVINSGIPIHYEEEIELRTGKRYFLSNKFPIRNKRGEVQAICGISTDITELNKALRDLERSRENYRNIVTNVPGIVYTGLVDDSRTMLFLSSGFNKVTGFEPENFLDGVQSFTNLIFDNDRERVLDTIKQAVAQNRSYEVEYRITDVRGEMRWLHEKGMSVKQSEGGHYLQGVMIDVTATKEAISEVMMRDRFLEGVAEAVKELIANQDSTEAIRKSLRIVAQSAMVDHSFIFKNDEALGDNQPSASHLYEWQKDQIKPIERTNLQNIKYSQIGSRWFHFLSDKKDITGYKDDFVEEEQFLFNELGLESLLVVPVFARNTFWGFIGFGNTDKGMPWVESHRAIFRAYTVTLGIAIAKEKDAVLLKEAKDDAEAATKAKSDFLARMSHEIRTPMNAIVGWTHLAIEKEVNPGQNDYLKKIQGSSKSLLGIINDILDFSKIEAGKLSIETIDYDLEQVFDDLSNMVAYKAHEKGLDFIYALHADVPLNLVGDPLRLSQILVNLVNNAVKFTNKGEIVTSVLVLQEDDNEVELLFEVKDTGIGIKEDLQEYLFDSFSQADVSTTRKYGGTGLGLAICKRLSELMGGRIWVESTYGEGSSFFFTMKAGKQKVQKRDLLIPPEDLENKHVLLLDNHPATSSIIKDMLELLKFRVTLKRRCDSAMIKLVESHQSDPIDLIIADWNIPGNKFSHAIQELYVNNTSKVPILVLINDFGQDHDLQTFINNKAIGSIIKPVNFSTLHDACLEAFGKEKTKLAWRKKEPGLYLNELREQDEVKVLLVEDNETNKQIGIELLELAGLNVDVVSNGKEAIAAVRDGGPNFFDLVLMDIQMPVMDGFDATKGILAMEEHASLPIIAMTADAIGGIKKKYLNAGMVDMIAKPIDPEQVYKKILKWVEKRRGSKRHKRKPIAIVEKPIIEIKPDSNNLPEIKGINVNEGVKRFANRWDFFKRLLQRFYFDHTNFVSEFNAVREDERDAAERMLHSFKGIAGTISAPKLYELAIQTEQDFKNGEPAFNEHFKELSQELETILKELSTNKAVDVEGFEKPK
ncbi:response regulator [Carboxylicivirga sediminis]|uniref:Sensory/regulatory protein RpfC n=1 Tax=Carboxylicivirga sediminis TaxID=2006564 RepID=A0A941F3C2_9BACT|nr:response regulator [Carboxylicivirga sediminis]MBR8535657.1 response regulator [Carboxylicivirga sediminis]